MTEITSFIDIMSKGFVSPKEAAPILGISHSTVRAMCNRGELQHIRVGTRYRIYLDEIKRFMQEGNFSE